MKIGKQNELTVARIVEFGLYLADEEGNEVLFPARYITDVPQVGDKMSVFVYTDSEDRPVATTEHPFAQVGEFAFLDVVAVTRIGAFLDWGLMKDILCPFREQKVRMNVGMQCLVYLYLDDASKRVACSAKIEKFLGNVPPDYKRGQKVSALVYKRTDQGYLCIVDNLHQGMVYHTSLYAPLEIGEVMEAHVAKVRRDGKIDLVAGGDAMERSQNIADRIITAMQQNGGFLNLDDKSSPMAISDQLHCSKKDFKKAVGHLLKQGKIRLEASGMSLFDCK